MLRSILVGLDGSTCSRSAVDLGILWAQKLDALLIGLGIVDEPSIRRPEPVPIGGGAFRLEQEASQLEEVRRRVDSYLDHFIHRCASAGVMHQPLKEAGVPHDEILRESQRHDLLLLGRQTYFQFGVEDYSDQTLRLVLRNAPSRPVVSVPEQSMTGRGVLVAYNGSREADLALQAFCRSGLDFAEEVHLLSMDTDLNRASRHAQHAAEYLQLHEIHTRVWPMTPPRSIAQTILDQIEQRQVRLLVMGAYGRSMMREILFGSITDTVLDECPVPAFMCH